MSFSLSVSLVGGLLAKFFQMDHQVLDLRIANCPVKNVTMITPPAESELNLDRRDKGLDYEPVATDLSRIYRLTP